MKLKSIRSKIMASIVCITFLTVIGIAAVVYRESARTIEENYITVFHQRIQLLTETIDEMMEDACYIGINASCDDEIEKYISDYLKTRDEKELENIAERLRIYKNQQKSISSIYFLLPETSQIITSMDYPVYKSNVDRNIITEYVQIAQGRPGPVIIDDLVSDEKKLLSFIEEVKDDKGRNIGYIYTNIEENRIFYDYFDNPEDEELKDFLLLIQNQIVTSKRNFEMGEIYKDYEKQKQYLSAPDVIGTDQDCIYIYCEGTFSGCGIFAQVEKKVILSALLKMRSHIAGMALIFILLSLLPSAYITQVVSRPVRRLVAAIERISQGDMSARVEVISDDEIGLMSGEFNRMLDQIQELIHQVMIEDEMKKDAELEALQYQITPHFMYNTLNSIKYSALIKGEAEIAQVIGNFIELLQTCISKKGAFLTVAEEVHILEKYIYLQEFRSGEKILLDYDIQPGAQLCLIPRLILQPLVENALIHGLDIKQKQGKLAIRAWVEKKVLYLEVEDNGRGMTQEQISNLLMSKTKKTKGLTAVGVPNVRDRLKLYYKEKAELSYKSSNEGTTATIYLPEIRDEE